MSSRDFGFLTLRNIQAYQPNGNPVPPNQVLVTSGAGQGGFTNSLFISSICVSTVEVSTIFIDREIASTINASSISTTSLVATSINTNFLSVNSTSNVSTVIASGKIGIGVTNPQANLDVAGDIYASNGFITQNTEYLDGPNIIYGDDTNSTILVHYYDGNFDTLQLAAAGQSRSQIKFNIATSGGTVATTQMILSRDGRLGIGTTNPQETLDVIGNANISGTLNVNLINSIDINVQSTINLYDGASTVELNAVGSTLYVNGHPIYTGGSISSVSSLFWQPGPNGTIFNENVGTVGGNYYLVGIGTNNAPLRATLDVNGSIRATSSLSTNIINMNSGVINTANTILRLSTTNYTDIYTGGLRLYDPGDDGGATINLFNGKASIITNQIYDGMYLEVSEDKSIILCSTNNTITYATFGPSGNSLNYNTLISSILNVTGYISTNIIEMNSGEIASYGGLELYTSSATVSLTANTDGNASLSLFNGKAGIVTNPTYDGLYLEASDDKPIYLSNTDNVKTYAEFGPTTNTLYYNTFVSSNLNITGYTSTNTINMNLGQIEGLSSINGIAWPPKDDALWSGSLTGNVYNDNTGNIGIGTNTPSYKLDVNGSIKSDAVVFIGTNGASTFDIAPASGGDKSLRLNGPNNNFGILYDTLFNPAVPYTGAINNLNMGNSSIITNTLNMNNGVINTANTILTLSTTNYTDIYTGGLRLYDPGDDGGATITLFNGKASIITNQIYDGMYLEASGDAPIRLCSTNNTKTYALFSPTGNTLYYNTFVSSNLNITGYTSTNTINMNLGQIEGLSSINGISWPPKDDALWSGSLTGNVYNDNTGNIGIGTTTPSYKLDVNGSIKSDAVVFIGTNGAPTFDIAPASGGDISLRLNGPLYNGGTVGYFYDTRYNPAVPYTGAINNLNMGNNSIITNTLNMTTGQINGLSSINSNITLQAGSAGSPGLRFSTDNDTGIYGISDGQMGISANGQERIRITNTDITLSPLTGNNVNIQNNSLNSYTTLNVNNTSLVSSSSKIVMGAGNGISYAMYTTATSTAPTGSGLVPSTFQMYSYFGVNNNNNLLTIYPSGNTSINGFITATGTNGNRLVNLTYTTNQLLTISALLPVGYTVSNSTYLRLEILAVGGGGGGGASFNGGFYYAGGGGGSGQEVKGTYYVLPTTQLTLTINGGGAGGTGGGSGPTSSQRGSNGGTVIVTSNNPEIKLSAIGGIGADNNNPSSPNNPDYGGNGFYGGGMGGAVNNISPTGSAAYSCILYPLRTGSLRYVPSGTANFAAGGNGDGPSATGGQGGIPISLPDQAGGGGGASSALGNGGRGGNGQTYTTLNGEAGELGAGGGGGGVGPGFPGTPGINAGNGGAGGSGAVQIQIFAL